MTFRRTRSSMAVLAAAVALVLTACGGGGGGSSEEGASTTPGETTTAPGGSGREGGSRAKRVNYVPAGPRDDDTPDNTNRWYEMLSKGQCRPLLDEARNSPKGNPATYIYRAAAEACLGMFDAAAKTRAAYPGDEIDPDDCGRTYVLAFVDQALAAWKADPANPPQFISGGSAAPCPKNPEGEEADEDGTTTTRKSGTTTTRASGTEGGAGAD